MTEPNPELLGALQQVWEDTPHHAGCAELIRPASENGPCDCDYDVRLRLAIAQRTQAGVEATIVFHDPASRADHEAAFVAAFASPGRDT
jgi:hypothetical protein